MHLGGKISVQSTVTVEDNAALAMAYTPWRRPGLQRDRRDSPELAAIYTWVANTVAVVSDGATVLGLGDIDPARRHARHGGQGAAVQAGSPKHRHSAGCR